MMYCVVFTSQGPYQQIRIRRTSPPSTGQYNVNVGSKIGFSLVLFAARDCVDGFNVTINCPRMSLKRCVGGKQVGSTFWNASGCQILCKSPLLSEKWVGLPSSISRGACLSKSAWRVVCSAPLRDSKTILFLKKTHVGATTTPYYRKQLNPHAGMALETKYIPYSSSTDAGISTLMLKPFFQRRTYLLNLALRSYLLAQMSRVQTISRSRI